MRCPFNYRTSDSLIWQMVSEHRFAFIVLKSVFALVLYRFQRQIYTQIRIQKGQEESITKAEWFKKKKMQTQVSSWFTAGWAGESSDFLQREILPTYDVLKSFKARPDSPRVVRTSGSSGCVGVSLARSCSCRQPLHTQSPRRHCDRDPLRSL